MENKFKKKNLSASSKAWIKRSQNDIYTKQAQLNNIPCRSYYKLEEIQKKYNICFKNMFVLDLGSSPGGWSYFFKKYTENIHGCDLLDTMEVEIQKFILGDFTFKDNQKEFIKYNLIVSDMAINTTGNKWMDQCTNNDLNEEVWTFVENHLLKNGNFVIKIFESEYTNEFLNKIKKKFQKVEKFKPNSSYKSSSEIYIVGKSFIFHNKDII
jgi:23S rRNA (uridine2552-2'-O)-methyltransferase